MHTSVLQSFLALLQVLLVCCVGTLQLPGAIAPAHLAAPRLPSAVTPVYLGLVPRSYPTLSHACTVPHGYLALLCSCTTVLRVGLVLSRPCSLASYGCLAL